MTGSLFFSVPAAVLGLLALGAGGRLFVSGASSLARRLGVSALVIGMTVVAMGTSLPELLVSVTASLTRNPGIALGNVVGSNIANVGFILGAAALLRPLAVSSTTLRREYPILLASALTLAAMSLGGRISRLEAVFLASAMVVFVIWSVRSARRVPADPLVATAVELVPASAMRSVWIQLAAGLSLLLVGSRALVYGAVDIARRAGLSETVIGLTLVAVGTSLPELVTTLSAAVRGEDDIAVGNVLGSNLFNSLGIVGAAGLIRTIPVEPVLIYRDMTVMLALSLVLWPVFINWRGHPAGGVVNRVEGAVLLAGYAAYMAVLFL